MKGRTHLAAGLFIGLLIADHMALSSVFHSALLILSSVLGSLFPDVDTVRSILGRKMRIVGWMSTHRGILHSPLILILMVPLLQLLSHPIATGFMAGFLSHVALDMLTPQGIKILPGTKRVTGPLRTGGLTEHILLFALSVSCMLILIS
ncbi:MAG: metal-dependent hydrolase [Nanoarchaeota archaeon]